MRLPASPSQRHGPTWPGAPSLVAGLTVAAASIAAAQLPPALVLPALSALLVGAAGVVALIAWMRPRREDPEAVSYWDAAGALTFLGICAALMSEPDQVVPLLEGRRGE